VKGQPIRGSFLYSAVDESFTRTSVLGCSGITSQISPGHWTGPLLASFPADGPIVNMLEQATGKDIDGDVDVGVVSPCALAKRQPRPLLARFRTATRVVGSFVNQLERVTGLDIDGDSGVGVE
jgi:hypothetical protein